MPNELSTSAFNALVIDADRPVLVDFYADGCGRCGLQAPVLEKIVSRFGGIAKIFRVNIGQNPELIELFEVRSVPIMILFASGNIVRRFTHPTQGRDLITAILASLDEC